MKYDEIITDCPQGGNGVHSWMMAVCNIAAREKIEENRLAEDIKSAMTREPSPTNEIETTIKKAYSEVGRTYEYHKETPEEREIKKEAVAKMQTNAFLKIAGDPIHASELMGISPVDTKTIKGYESQMAAKLLLYLYDRKEIVWCGGTYDMQCGIDYVENWAEKFLCLESPPPFFIPNPLTGLPGNRKDGQESYRCDQCIADWRYALFEVDLKDVTLGHQAAFWMKMIKDDKMPVESVTYSGGKSLHALIRVDCKTEIEWDKKVRNGAFMEWIKVGADKACRNPSRLSRLPGHKRDKKTTQTLLWLRGGK